jgi:hypothetical protein
MDLYRIKHRSIYRIIVEDSGQGYGIQGMAPSNTRASQRLARGQYTEQAIVLYDCMNT